MLFTGGNPMFFLARFHIPPRTKIFRDRLHLQQYHVDFDMRAHIYERSHTESALVFLGAQPGDDMIRLRDKARPVFGSVDSSLSQVAD